MVFFTCNACGESLKKAQVDKHVNMCRGCQVLSCIDCGKDFWGEDYKNHIKCITEDQKYGGKGYEAKSNKGDVKQQLWIQRIHEAMNKPGISAKMKDVLTQVSSYDNVPRKKAKFQNWMKNSLKIYTPTLHDQVWEIFSAATSNAPDVQVEQPQQPEIKQPAAEVQADSNGRKEKTKKGKDKKRKRKMDDEDQDEQQNGHGAGEEATAKKSKGKDKKKKRKMDEDEQQNGHGAGEEATAKKSKNKKSKNNHEADSPTTEAAEEQTSDTEAEAASNGKFNWKGTIKAVLRQSPEEELAVKKLRKKVLAAYYSFSGEGNFKSEVELLALFNKKISSNPKFRVLKEKVRLVK